VGAEVGGCWVVSIGARRDEGVCPAGCLGWLRCAVGVGSVEDGSIVLILGRRGGLRPVGHGGWARGGLVGAEVGGCGVVAIGGRRDEGV
jgi:hypothetical protein